MTDSHETSKKDRHVQNPYQMNRHKVKLHHFRDARIYDTDITEPGWEVPYYVAKKKYDQWLRAVRRKPGWENFRRPVVEVEEELEDEDGQVYVFRKIVPRFQAPRTNQLGAQTYHRNNNRKRPYAQSVEKGVKVDDDRYRPRMITKQMGKEISRLRQAMGLTQAELAKKINVETNLIRDIELGDAVPYHPEDMILKNLARALNVPSIRYRE